MFFSVGVVLGFVGASLLLLLLLGCLVCWFVGLFVMACTVLKFELSIRVVLGIDFLYKYVDSVTIFILICPLPFYNV